MEVTIKAKNVEITNELEMYTERKLNKLIKLSPRLQDITVTFVEQATKKNSRSHRAELVVHAPGQTLKAEEEKESFYIALDSALDKIKRQFRKLKTKRIDKTREATRETKPKAAKEMAQASELKSSPMIYVERFSVKPMSTDEARMQLSLNGKTFLLFVNRSNAVNCLYKREDGDFGLIIPENED